MKIQVELSWTNNISKFGKLSSYKIRYPKVNRKDFYFIWAGSESKRDIIKTVRNSNFSKICWTVLLWLQLDYRIMLLFLRKQAITYLLEFRRINIFHTFDQGVNSQCFRRESFQLWSWAMESRMRSINESIVDYLKKLQ